MILDVKSRRHDNIPLHLPPPPHRKTPDRHLEQSFRFASYPYGSKIHLTSGKNHCKVCYRNTRILNGICSS